jgi:TetR/AcrR family transcriptional repressor of nem operon
LDRVLGYLDFRKALLKGEVAEFSCLAGTMLQEVYRTHAEIRQACDASISGHAAMVEADIAEAMKLYGVGEKWSAQSLALYTQAVLQGAFILAKAKGGPDVAATSIDHLRRYIELLFRAATHRKRRLTAPQASYGSGTPTASRTRTCLARLRSPTTIAPLSVGRDIDTINPKPGL